MLTIWLDVYKRQVMMDGAMSAVLGTSYTSEDPDIIQTEANYTALETALQNEMCIRDRNNMHDIDTFMFFKWAFKSAAAAIIVNHTFDFIVSGFTIRCRQIQLIHRDFHLNMMLDI